MIEPRRIEPGPGQESVWDYPRPPRLEASDKLIQVVFNGVTIAESRHAKRVLETSHPPVYYLRPEDVKLSEYFSRSPRTTFCEWKGSAHYYTITVGDRTLVNGAWDYPEPIPAFQDIQNHVAVYPGKMDACFVNGELVQAQPGDFYGGWITQDIVGPFKGSLDTLGW